VGREGRGRASSGLGRYGFGCGRGWWWVVAWVWVAAWMGCCMAGFMRRTRYIYISNMEPEVQGLRMLGADDRAKQVMRSYGHFV